MRAPSVLAVVAVLSWGCWGGVAPVRASAASSSAGFAVSWGDNVFGALGAPIVPGAQVLIPHEVGSDANWLSVTTASSGSSVYSIAIRRDHSLWAWGDNAFSQLGDGTADSRTLPEQIGSATDWARVIATGNQSVSDHVFALKMDGSLWGWGTNGSGALGDGTTGTVTTTPKRIGVATWREVASSDDHTVGIESDGSLWIWGDNFVGELGDGTMQSPLAPERLGSDTDWAHVATGTHYTLAIKTDGTLWGWGVAQGGELGDGAGTQVVTAPEQIGAATNWRSIVATDGSASVSGDQSSFATKTDGTLWAWGQNESGQLGDGTTKPAVVPEQVGTAKDWVGVAGGSFHTVGIKTDGSLWVWGTGTSGNGAQPDSFKPVRLGTDNDWQSVAAGGIDSIAVKTNGTMWAWGYNWVPDLPPHFPLLLPQWRTTAGAVHTQMNFTQISAELNDVLAVGADGSLWGWGYNTSGELGDDTVQERADPVQIGTDKNWRTVAGANATSVALRTDGTLWSWGQNYYGNLGRSGDPFAPGQVGTDTNWSAIAAGNNHALAIKTDGTLWSWGSNSVGQLGTGDGFDASTPTQVDSDNNWAFVAAADDFTIAIRKDGSLWAWGDDSHGQLGRGSIGATSNIPRQVGTDTDWQTVAVRNNHVIALKTTGTLWGWGDNTSGALGVGTLGNDIASPTQIGTDTDWAAIATGWDHTIALRTDRSAWAWGDNTVGQLGDGTTASHSSPEQVAANTDWTHIIAGHWFSGALATNSPASVPAAPIGVHATAGNHNADVSWQTPGDDGGSPIVSYTVTATPGGQSATIDASHHTFGISGLSPSKTYTFTVHATNATGNSPESTASNPIRPLGVPNAPAAVHATKNGGSVSISWTAPASNGSTITRYTITTSRGRPTITIPGNRTHTSLNGLPPGNYSFQVSATNAIGTGPRSAPSPTLVIVQSIFTYSAHYTNSQYAYMIQTAVHFHLAVQDVPKTGVAVIAYILTISKHPATKPIGHVNNTGPNTITTTYTPATNTSTMIPVEQYIVENGNDTLYIGGLLMEYFAAIAGVH